MNVGVGRLAGCPPVPEKGNLRGAESRPLCRPECWPGSRPPVSREVIVVLIIAITTSSGLRVRAEPDCGVYPLGMKVSGAALAAVPPTRHDWQGE